MGMVNVGGQQGVVEYNGGKTISGEKQARL